MSSDLKDLIRELSEASEQLPDDPTSAGFQQRHRVIQLTNKIRSAVEQPVDRVSTYHEYIAEMAALRLFMDWNAFAHIPPGPDGISYADLAKRLDAEERLVRRMGRLLVLKDILKPAGLDGVAHTKLSEEFVRKDGWGAWFRIGYDSRNRTNMRWREFFAKYGRKEPVNATHGNPQSFAHDQDDKSFWDILDQHFLEDFNASMRMVSQAGTPPEIFPWKWIAENAQLVAPDAALVVDVGGGFGHELEMMRKECPDIPAERMVLQDRPNVIEEITRLDPPESRGVRKMAHDFFAEQPVKGALVYFFKRIMHDWSDKYCRQILGRIRDVMAPESRVLIYDFVMTLSPTIDVVVADLAMMNLSAKQRTEEDWKELLTSSGFEILRIWKDPRGVQDGVIECKRSGDH